MEERQDSILGQIKERKRQSISRVLEKGMTDEELAKKFNLGIEGVKALKGRLRGEELK